MLRGLEDFDLKDCGLTNEICETLGAKPVVHAQWIEEYCGMRHTVRCSYCNEDLPSVETGCTLEHPDFWKDYIDKTDYCPHCGAKMSED